MTRTDSADTFGLLFRMDHWITYNLLHVAGPPQLDEDRDPRLATHREYLRRRDLHRARRGLPPLPPEPTAAPGANHDVTMAVIAGVVVVALLVVWAVLSR